MSKNGDIVTRLNNAVPYGLEDYAVLSDAAAEIEELRRSRHYLNEELLRANERITELSRLNEFLARQVAAHG